MPVVNASVAKVNLATSVQALERASTTLQTKANWLRQHRSPDAVQQMQTEAILDLCEAVRQIQQAMSGLPILIPDVSAVRDAAGGSPGASSTLNLTPIPRLTR